MTKTAVVESLETLPEQSTIEEIIDYLQSLADLETAMQAIQAGTVRPHAEVMAEARTWLSEKNGNNRRLVTPCRRAIPGNPQRLV